MSTLLTREWGGSDDDSWTTVGWSKIAGGGLPPVIQSGAGWGPTSSGTEFIYRATGFPQLTGYLVHVDATWKNAAGAGRILGICVRCLEDGRTYSLELDSNVGTTRCRIRRRSAAGSWTDLVAWASPAGIPASAQMNSGITLTAKVVNDDADQVTLTLLFGSTVLATYTDTSSSRIESGGGAGLYGGSTWADDDIVVDNFLVEDFEDDWAGSGDLGDGVSIIVDGTYYSQADLEAAGITPRMPRDSIGDPTAVVCTFETRDLYYETNPILYAGAFVKVAVEGTVMACGRLRLPRRIGNAQGAGQTWDLTGPTQLAADVVLRDPNTGENTIRWNLPEDHVEYDPERVNITPGAAIADVLDSHVDGDGNLRDQGAAPPDEDDAPYVQAELDLITGVVPELSGSQDPYAAVEEILSHTQYVLRIDPDTLVWHFVDRTGGTVTDVDLADDVVEWELEPHLEDAYTAAEAIGARPETTDEVLSVGSGLSTGWAAGLESTHDASKSYKNRQAGSADTTGTSGGRVTMTPDTPFDMDADEWLECRLKFLDGDEAGEVYPVYDNSATTFVLDEATWRNGGPSPGDTFEVYGARHLGGRDNGHREIGRRFLLTDLDKGIPQDACAVVTIRQDGIEIRTKGVVRTPDDETLPAEIMTDLPSVGLVNYAGGTIPDPCTEGDAQALSSAEIEIEVPTYSRSDPAAPRRRYPTAGYVGTSFTRDEDKWSGGGERGRGDPGVKRTYPLPIPGYDGSASMQSEVDTVLQAILAFLSPVPREVTCTIKGRLDTTWIGLNRRLTISHTGGNATGLESADDLFVYAVEYDVLAKTTTVYAGTQGSGSFRPEKIRKAILDRKLAMLNARSRAALDDLVSCFTTKPQEVGQVAPQQLCGEQISIPGSSGGVTTPLAAAMENIACKPNTTPKEKCNSFNCITTFAAQAAQLIANADALTDYTVVDQYTRDFDPGVDRCGDALPGDQLKVIDAVVWLMAQVKVLTYGVVAIAGAHDAELVKTQTDLASIRGNLTNLVACINAGWIAIDTCFKAKVDSGTEQTGCDIDPCSHDFTETVCETPCDADQSTADESTPPDCSGATCS